MANNTTSIFEISVNSGTADTRTNHNSDISVLYLEIINWILFVLTLAVFLFGVTSWCNIKKFRHFRNYVLLSAILANVLQFLVTVMSYVNRPETKKHPLVLLFSVCVLLYCVLAYNYWLLVLSYIFYVDFVKVFNVDIRRRYLKSSLFAWGVPLGVSLIYFHVFFFNLFTRVKITHWYFPVAMLMLLMPVVINLVIYVLVVYSLFRGSEAGASTSTNKWRRFYIATLIFVLSDVIIVFTGLLQVIQMPLLKIHILVYAGEYMNIIALDIYFLLVKSNRVLWREFVNKTSKQRRVETKKSVSS